MKASRRLKENRDFRRVFARGKSTSTTLMVLYWLERRQPSYRLGFSVSKKVGNAVVRNLVKRRLRGWFDECGRVFENKGLDIVIVCRPPAATATYAQLSADLARLLRRARIMV